MRWNRSAQKDYYKLRSKIPKETSCLTKNKEHGHVHTQGVCLHAKIPSVFPMNLRCAGSIFLDSFDNESNSHEKRTFQSLNKIKPLVL